MAGRSFQSRNAFDYPVAGSGAVDSVFGRTGSIVAATSDYDAVQIDNTPAGNIAATNVQAALNELDTEKAAASHTHVQADVTNLVSDLAGKVPTTRTITAGSGLSGGGDLSANRSLALDINGLTNDASPDLAADYVPTYDASAAGLKKVLLNLLGPIRSVFGRTGVVVATNGDYTATQITNTPAGNIAATTVQAALNELDTEKAAASHAHAQADVTNLTTDLAAKVAKAGDTMTGNLAVQAQYSSAKYVATYAASQTINWDNGNVQEITLTGNITSLTLSNPVSGARYLLVLKQDGTGGRTVAWPAAIKWPGAVAPVLSGSNKRDIISLIYDGSVYYCQAAVDFPA